jgi:hypothetical protein
MPHCCPTLANTNCGLQNADSGCITSQLVNDYRPLLAVFEKTIGITWATGETLVGHFWDTFLSQHSSRRGESRERSNYK